MARYSKINSFNALQILTVGAKSYQIFGGVLKSMLTLNEAIIDVKEG